MTRLSRSLRVPVVLLAAGLLLSACATTVGRVTADPSRYRDREVTVNGTVVDSVSVAGRGAYRLADDTGSLWVVSTRGVPREGARVRARGRIQDAFDLSIFGGRVNLPGGASSGVVMLESSHTLR